MLGILWLYWIGSVLALVFADVATRQLRERGEAGMATPGIVLGWVGTGILVLGVLFRVAAYSGIWSSVRRGRPRSRC